jgi:excisionase family DNA binding protein
MTMYRLIHHGGLRSIRIGRSFRIPAAAVDEYLHRQLHQ